MKRNRLGGVLLVVAAFFAIMATTAGSNHGNRVDIKDDCNATFNANPPVGPGLGPNTCVKIQGTDFQDFIGQLMANGVVPNASADGWEFYPGNIKIETDETLSTRNKGGEFHTFTEVQNFGGGCVAALNNVLHLTPVPECNALLPDGVTPVVFATTGVPSGGTSTVSGLAPGMHKFECMIHPWMRTTVDVRAADDD